MKQSAKRLFSMFLALFFLIATFVLYFDLVQPAYNSVQLLRGQLAGENQALASEKALVTQAQTLIAAYKQGHGQTAGVSLAIPDGEDVAGALAQMEGIASNNNVVLTGVSISTPGLATDIPQSITTNGTTTATMRPLGSYSVNLTGSASYENFKSFLDELETNIRIFDVKTVAFSPSPSATGVAGGRGSGLGATARDSFDFVVSVQTYYELPTTTK
jgi:hypothetical protein